MQAERLIFTLVFAPPRAAGAAAGGGVSRRERLHLGGGMSVETGRDWNGRFYIAHAHGAAAATEDTQP
jgi:hypothetical protein